MRFHQRIRLPAERRQLAVIRSFVEEQAAKTPASEEEVRDLVLAVDEAATNIIVHGYRDGYGEIELELDYRPGQISVILRDQAPPFDPAAAPEPDLTLPLEKRPVGGLGVHIIRKCVSEFQYAARPQGGNELRLVKYLQDKGGKE